MKKLSMILLLAVFCCGFTVNAAATGEDKEKIKEVIKSAYVEGIQNAGSIEDIQNGFHPGFNLLVYKGDVMDKLPIYNWIEYVKKRKEKNPEPPAEDQKVSVEFENIDVTGTAAVAKIKLFRAGQHIFTDYLSLYNFSDKGWKIVGKIYYRIPE